MPRQSASSWRPRLRSFVPRRNPARSSSFPLQRARGQRRLSGGVSLTSTINLALLVCALAGLGGEGRPFSGNEGSDESQPSPASMANNGAAAPNARDLQDCQVCCDEYDGVVTCIDCQIAVVGNPDVGGCANCVDGLISTGTCDDVLLETCQGIDSCLCESSCRLFTDEYLRCMKDVDCFGNPCGSAAADGDIAEEPAEPGAGDEPADEPAEPDAEAEGEEGGRTICQTEEECMNKVQELGIAAPVQSGGFPTKGCFIKNGAAFFGVGGTDEEMSIEVLPGVQERVWCDEAVATVTTTTTTTQPMSDVCNGDNSLCESGVCGMDNVCAPEKLPAGSPCRADEDGMCQSGYCARESSEDVWNDHICCSRSGKAWSGKGSTHGYVCVRATGEACDGDSALCEPGICGMDDVCAEEKIKSGDPCREDEDEMCYANVCSRGEEREGAAFICCPSGEKVWSGLVGSTGGYICANALDAPIATTATTSTEVSWDFTPAPTAEGDPEDEDPQSAATTTVPPGTTTTTTTFDGVYTPPASEPSARLNEMGAAHRCGGYVVPTVALYSVAWWLF